MVWNFLNEKATVEGLNQLHEQYLRDIDVFRRVSNDRAKEIEQLKETVDHMGKVAVERTAQIQTLIEKVSVLATKASPAELSAIAARMEALELRQSQMHGMLTEDNPVTGKKKLSPLGKRIQTFYGKH